MLTQNDKIKYYDYIGPNKDIFNNGSNDPSSGTHWYESQYILKLSNNYVINI